MFCFLYKWMISRARDLGRELSGPVTNHIRRCRACREFDRFSQSLAGRFARGLPGFVRNNNHILEEKIIAGLAAKPATELPRKRHLLPLPTPALPLAAALVILVVTSGIILLQIISPSPPGSIGNSKAFMDGFTPSASLRVPFIGIVRHVESSVEAEMRGLEKTVKSAAKHLASCLDFKIGPLNNGAQGNRKKI